MMMGSVASATLIASAACGQSTQIYSFDLPAQSLKSALKSVARQGDVDLFAMSEDLAGRQALALRGSYTVQGAFDTLLAGSGLSAEVKGGRVFVRPTGVATDGPNPADIVVTGSRIRGAPVASPVLSLSQDSILESGKTTLGEAVRTLPQNFGGGQNPGIAGNGAQGNNANFNSSSTINLRGLGPDATLTLLNGHRIAYDSEVQGIDIDAIPLAAIDQIEIVPDGASALYGSDAVGGVANIVLKKDYEGATVSTRIGTTTEGGGSQQRYDAVAGTRWHDGGVITSIDYSHAGAVTAGDRDITSALSPDQTLYPEIRHLGVTLAGHQAIGAAQFSMDAFYSRRTSPIFSSYTAPDSWRVNGFEATARETSFEISPKLTVPIGSSWQTYVSGTYGRDRSHRGLHAFLDSENYLNALSRFDNSIRSVEAGADGPVLHYGGKTARIALGGGYRSIGFLDDVETEGSAPARTFARQTAYYAFGELSVPLVDRVDDIPAIASLSVSGAARFESYRHGSRVATPKFGVIYKPVANLTLKGSWGQSFKAPTLEQQFYPGSGVSLPASYFGAGYPASASVLLLNGGNLDLRPERATSYAATLEYAPGWAHGLTASASYFHTSYRHRVVEPLASIVGAFNNPAYQYLIRYAPTAAELAALAAATPGGIVSGTNTPYDPSTVVAIVDDRQHNALRQAIHGVDGQLSWKIVLAGQRSITATGAASYLRLSQQLGPGQALIPLSGHVYHMPSWNAHAALSYTDTSLTLTADLTYTGSLIDDRFAPTVRVGSMTTLDLTGLYHLRSTSRLLDRIDILLTVQNLLDTKPPRLRSTDPNDTPYDSSNYSAFGRFVAFTLSKSF
jgi:outer membrane receptor protein involved in Fe transport